MIRLYIFLFPVREQSRLTTNHNAITTYIVILPIGAIVSAPTLVTNIKALKLTTCWFYQKLYELIRDYEPSNEITRTRIILLRNVK